jgi:hypothetical protein
MKIDWNKIKNESFLALEKFLFWLQKNDYFQGYRSDSAFAMHLFELLELNPVCYCDLEKFFDDNNLIITYKYLGGWYWIYIEQSADWKGYLYSNVSGIKTRDEAKQQAIYKAFEILEKELNK